MKANTDLVITALLLGLVIALGVVLELVGKPVPGLLDTAGTVLLGSVAALARGAVAPGSRLEVSPPVLPSDVPVIEGPR